MLRKLITKCMKVSLAVILFTAIFTTSQSANAAPAYPGVISVTQPDGSKLSIQMHGDEFFGWSTAKDGYPVINKDGYYYYADYSANGAVKATTQRVGVANSRAFLRNMPRQNMQQIAARVSMQRRSQAGNATRSKFPHQGKVKSVIILVEYKDFGFQIPNPRQAFENQLNQPGYAVEGATGSARDYFLESSDNQFEGDFDVFGPYELSKVRAFYGGRKVDANDANPREMIREAVKLADEDGVDFSEYDLDGDGLIDNVFVYYAGHNEAEGGHPDSVWPHKWDMFGLPDLMVDGKKLFGYACTSELRGNANAVIAGIGTFCHEFSHVFGLSDHYDTNGEFNGSSSGLGAYDIMTMGSYNNYGNTPPLMNALEMEIIGWNTPQEFTGNELISLEPIQNGVTYKIPTEVEGEYFLVENRSKSSSVWDEYIPADGLIITHVDRSAAMADRWAMNQPNAYADHECFKFVVSGDVLLNSLTWGKVPYPQPLSNEWTPYSRPRAMSWSGELLPVQLTNIVKDGENIKFNVATTVINSITGIVKNSTQSTPIINADVSISSVENTSMGKIASYRINQSKTYNTKTNENGRYSFDDIVDGEYRITVKSGGYVEYIRDITVEQGGIHNVVMFTVEQNEMHSVGYHNGNYKTSIYYHDKFRPNIILPEGKLKAHVGRKVEQFKFYATAPFEGVVMIINNTTGAPAGEEIIITSSELGWKTIDFSNKDIYIEENSEYKISIMVLYTDSAVGAVALDDDETLQYNLFSNLVEYEGGVFSNIYTETGNREKGNLMFELLLSKESMFVPPTSIVPESASLTIPSNQKTQVKWSSEPYMSNKHCNWTSSDETVAKVSDDGVILAVSNGSAVITARSIVATNISMTVDVNVTDSQIAKATGNIRVYPGNTPVQDIDITLTALPQILSDRSASYAKGDGSKILNGDIKLDSRRVRLQESPLPSVTETTNNEGNYSFDNLLAGYSYSAYVSMDNLLGKYISSGFKTDELKPFDPDNADATVNKLEYLELTANPVYENYRHKYYENPDNMAFVSSPSAMMYAIKIKKEDLVDKIGHAINVGDAYFGEIPNPYVEMSIMVKEDGRFVNLLTAQNSSVKSGYNQFDFFGGVIIHPDTDYYIAVQGIIQFGMEKTNDQAHNGLSNLIWDNGNFVPLSDIHDFNGNWLISVFFKEKVIEEVSSISLSVNPEFVPLVGVQFGVSAEVMPVTAIYKELIWTSSDENIAKVSPLGEVIFTDDKPVTITATSSKYPSISGSIELEATLEQGLQGYTLESDGNSLLGVEVIFYPIISEIKTVGGMQMESFTRVKDVKPYTVVSSTETGWYGVALPAGMYEIESKVSGLEDYYAVIDVKRAMNSYIITLNKRIENSSTYKSYATPSIDHLMGAAGALFTPLAKWDATDLKDMVGDKITRIRALVGGESMVNFVIYILEDAEYVYRSEPISIGDYVTMASVEIPAEKHVTIEEDKTYLVGYEIYKYHGSINPAPISYINTLPGVADYVVNNGVLTTLSELQNGPVGNWVIGFYIQSDEQIKGIDIDAGQVDALISWNAADFSHFKLYYGLNGETKTTIDLIESKVELTSLKEGSDYEVLVSGSHDGKEFRDILNSKFTTIPRVVDIPMILIGDYEQVAGDIINLKIVNLNSGDQVEWSYNGVSVPRNKLILTKGEQIVRCKVTRGDKVFIVNRVINVK